MSIIKAMRAQLRKAGWGPVVGLSCALAAASIEPVVAQTLTPSGQSLSRAATLPTDVDLISGSAANIYRDALVAIDECDDDKFRQALAGLRVYQEQLGNLERGLVDDAARMRDNESEILKDLAKLLPDIDGTPLGPDGTGANGAIDNIAKQVGTDLVKSSNEVVKEVGGVDAAGAAKKVAGTVAKEVVSEVGSVGPESAEFAVETAGKIVSVVTVVNEVAKKVDEVLEKMKIAQEAREILTHAVIQANEVKLADIAIGRTRDAEIPVKDWIGKLEALWDSKCRKPVTENYDAGQEVAKETTIVDQSTQQIIPEGKGIFIPNDGSTIRKLPYPKTGKIENPGTPTGKVDNPQTPLENPQPATDGGPGTNGPGEVIIKPQCHAKITYDGSNPPNTTFTPHKPLKLFFWHIGCRDLQVGDPTAPEWIDHALQDQYHVQLDLGGARVPWKTDPVNRDPNEPYSHEHCIVTVYGYKPVGPVEQQACVVPDGGRPVAGSRPVAGRQPPSGGGDEPTIPKDGPTHTHDGGIVEGDQPREIQGPPLNDPFVRSRGSWGQPYADQWYLRAINWLKEDGTTVLPAAGALILVAVIDTGVDFTHPKLLGAMWHNPKPGPQGDIFGWNFVDGNADLTDLSGHGTIIAGIIAADSGDGYGIAGINPWARIMPLKALDFDGNGGSIGVAQAIRYAADHGARVINLSVGGRTLTEAEQDAVDYATQRNVLVVAASGNQGTNTSNFSPAGLKNVLAVAAVGPDLKRQSFSNWGSTIGIAAPGVDILSLRARQTDLLQLMRDDYKPESAVVAREFYRVTGSSFAAPMVAGAASLLMSANPKLTAAQVKRMLTQSARDLEGIGTNQFDGYGLLDVAAAMAADPNSFVEAVISGVAVVQKGGQSQLRVSGVANSNKLKEAYIEIGAGDNPDQWKRVSQSISKPVVNDSAIADLPADVFRGSKVWTLRLLVSDQNGKQREARFRLNLGGG
jgi:hypothetical protein